MLKSKTAIVLCSLAASLPAFAMSAARVVMPSNDVSIPASIREKLAQCEDVRAFTPLPSGDDVVVFDTVRDRPDSPDFMDNHPHLAFFHAGNVVFDLDAVDVAPVGPVRFHGLVLSPQPDKTVTLIAAFTLGVDSAETFFVFVGQNPKGYETIATLSGGQAQLRFNENLQGHFELWAADGQAAHKTENQCVWCRKYYEMTSYQFDGGKLRKLSTSTSKQAYEPEPFFEKPFALSSEKPRAETR